MKVLCRNPRNPKCRNPVSRLNIRVCDDCAPKSIPESEIYVPSADEPMSYSGYVREAVAVGKRYFKFNWMVHEILDDPDRCDCCDPTSFTVGVWEEIVEPSPGVPALNALPKEVREALAARMKWRTAARRREQAQVNEQEAYKAYHEADRLLQAEHRMLAFEAYAVREEKEKG